MGVGVGDRLTWEKASGYHASGVARIEGTSPGKASRYAAGERHSANHYRDQRLMESGYSWDW